MKQFVNCTMDWERTVSITSVSREKRLRMRPAVLVSKKAFGRRRRWVSSLLWRVRAASTEVYRKRRDLFWFFGGGGFWGGEG
jgi:hypothetical protein